MTPEQAELFIDAAHQARRTKQPTSDWAASSSGPQFGGPRGGAKRR